MPDIAPLVLTSEGSAGLTTSYAQVSSQGGKPESVPWLRLSKQLIPVTLPKGASAALGLNQPEANDEVGGELNLALRGIAHDFNNLMMVIAANADMAMRDLDPVSDAAFHIEQIRLAILHAADFVQRLLSHAEQHTEVVRPLQLTAVVAETVALLRSSFPQTLSLRLNLEEQLPLVVADELHLRQVVMNLCINAVEAIGDAAGQITVTTGIGTFDAAGGDVIYAPAAPNGLYAYLKVADTGCGIDPAIRSAIFTPAFTTKIHGNGLGLPLVLQIVRRYQGILQMQSSIGQGTTCTVMLPCADLLGTPRPPSVYEPSLKII